MKPISIIICLALVTASAAVVAQGTLQAEAGANKVKNVGQAVAFDGSASTGDITGYNWDFGDGSTGTGVTVSHTYATQGTYTVTLTVVSATGDTDQDTLTATIRASDTTKPTITHTDVTSATPGQAVVVRANITDNTGVGSATLFYKNATLANFQSTTMSVDPDRGEPTYKASIPSSVVDGTFVLYYIRAKDSATAANTQGYPSGVLNDNTKAVNVTLADTAGPTITHAPASTARTGTAITISATVTDTSGVQGATLFYRNASKTSWQNTGMSANGDTYSAEIPSSASVLSTSHVHYYIRATDASSGSNQATRPTTAPGTPFGICVSSSGSTAPTISNVNAPSSVGIGNQGSITFTVTIPSGTTVDNSNVTAFAKVGSTWVPGNTTSAPTGTTRSFTFTLPGNASKATGLQYYIEVTGQATGPLLKSYHGCTVNPKTVPTLPAVPILSLGSSSITTGTSTLSVSWTDVSARYYHLQRNASGTWRTVANATTASTSLDVSGLTSSTGTHQFRVKAFGSKPAQSVTSALETLTITPAPSGGGGGGGGGSSGGTLAAQARGFRAVPSDGATEAYRASTYVRSSHDSVESSFTHPGSPVAKVVTSVEGTGSFAHRLQVFTAAPPGAPVALPPGVAQTALSWFTVEVTGSGNVVPGETTLTVKVPTSKLASASPNALVVLHGTSEAWELLTTKVISTETDEVVLEATALSLSPFAVTLDEEPPTIFELEPTDGSEVEDNTPPITGSWSDNRAVDPSTATLLLDGEPVDAEVTETGFSYTPAEPLAEGEHTVTATVSDDSGHETSETWSFTVLPSATDQADEATEEETTDDAGADTDPGTQAPEDGGAAAESSRGSGLLWILLLMTAVLAGAGWYMWDQRREDEE